MANVQIRIIDSTVVDGRDVFVGDEISVSEQTARALISCKQGEALSAMPVGALEQAVAAVRGRTR
jgi:hypothetical protein